MAQYRVLFVEFATGGVWGELPVSEVRCTSVASGVGAATLVTDLVSFPWSVLTPWRTLLYVQRGQQVIWGGPLLGFAVDLESGRVTLSAVGLWEYYRRRQITRTVTFTQLDQGLIARRLVEDYADGTGSIPWNTGPAALRWDGSEVTGVPRDRTYYAHERKGVGQAVEALGAVADGFGFRIDYGWLGGRITNTVHLYPPGGEPTDVVLEHGATATIPSLTVDGAAMATEAAVTGSGDAETQLVRWWYNLPAETDPSRRIPRLSVVESHQDVTVPDTLTGYARRLISAGAAAVTIPAVRLHPDTYPGPGDLRVGHQAQVRAAVAGHVLVDGTYMAAEVEIKADGTGEETTVRMVPEEAFADVGTPATP
ncbi:hypothetical protein [Kitasatospora sp. NPDC001527]|uniref:hypothetical protein n=1 Tax=Kitasatospora sp. NPDC001527 TaxID=3154519 RepID=UPI003317E417